MALFHLQFGIHNAFPLTTSQRAVRALEAAVMPGLQPRHGPAQPAWPQTPCGPPLGTHCPGMLRGQPLPAPPLPAPIGPQTVYPSPTGSWHHRSGKPRPYCCRDLEACPPHSVAMVTLGLTMWPCKCCRLQPLVGCGEMFWCPWAAPAPLLLWWGRSHSFSYWRPARS